MTTKTTPLVRTTFVPCTPERAFTAFTDDIGQWWPLATHSVHHDQAAGVAFEDGHLVEHSVDGQACTWGEVVTWDPPNSFSMTWHPGYSADQHTIVSLTFRAEGEGTRVDLEHSGWEIFAADAANRRASYADVQGWDLVLGAFARESMRA